MALRLSCNAQIIFEQMIELTRPGSKILNYQGEMYKLLGKHMDRGYDKESLGLLVKYYGGNKILKKDHLLLVCEKIEDAEIVA